MTTVVEELLRPLCVCFFYSPGELVPVSMPQMLLEYCQQIVLGMSYLATKGFVHRDLAARNILLSDDNICKVREACRLFVMYRGVWPL